MSLVGSFPGMSLSQIMRRTIRAPVNSMDKSTIVSIFPRRIHEIKHTIQPGVFVLEPGSVEKPSMLIVGPSSWWKDIDPDQPLLEIPNSSIQVADSVVRDYCNGLLGCNMADSMPGIFWVPGAFKTLDALKKAEFEELQTTGEKIFATAVAKQNIYYKNLVKLGDTMWARTNGNPLTISDDMRTAAKALGENRDWMKDFQLVGNIPCVACGSPRNPLYPVCPHCNNIVDAKKAAELGITPATPTK